MWGSLTRVEIAGAAVRGEHGDRLQHSRFDFALWCDLAEGVVSGEGLLLRTFPVHYRTDACLLRLRLLTEQGQTVARRMCGDAYWCSVLSTQVLESSERQNEISSKGMSSEYSRRERRSFVSKMLKP
eukprot:2873518-Amphidinium_carterae.2